MHEDDSKNNEIEPIEQSETKEEGEEESTSRLLEGQELEEALDELADFVIETAKTPMNYWAVAALLESMGLRDIDSEEKYGKKHIFDLAQDVFKRSVNKIKLEPQEVLEPYTQTFKQTIINFFKYYIEGTVIAVPMAGQVAAILILRYSLWAWLDFSELQASLVAFGTIGSFIFSGGLIQAIGRESTFYDGQNNPYLLEKVCLNFFKIGFGGTSLICFFAFILNLIFPYFKIGEISVAITYCILLTALWLILSILFVLKLNTGILLCTLFGTGFVYLFMEYFESSIYVAHWAGIVMAFITAYATCYVIIRNKKKKADDKCLLAKLPRASILLYIIEPFLIFGTLYFSLLFADRIVGWSASDMRLPLLVWFRTPYELGMDWALCSLIITFAVLNYTVNEFNQKIIPVQQSITSHNFKKGNEFFMDFYKKQCILLGIIAVISILIIYALGVWAKETFQIAEVEDFFSNPITFFTFWFSAIGYALLAFGQLNSLFYFSLAKPHPVIRSIGIGLLVNIGSGFLLSRLISYEYSVLGLVFGSGVYAYLSTKDTLKMLRDLDYYYYSAF